MFLLSCRCLFWLDLQHMPLVPIASLAIFRRAKFQAKLKFITGKTAVTLREGRDEARILPLFWKYSVCMYVFWVHFSWGFRSFSRSGHYNKVTDFRAGAGRAGIRHPEKSRNSDLWNEAKFPCRTLSETSIYKIMILLEIFPYNDTVRFTMRL